MVRQNSLEREAAIEIQRRSLRAMPEPQLRGMADSLLVSLLETQAMLTSAMRRIAELEVSKALMDCDAAVTELCHEQRQLSPIGAFLHRWRRR